MTMTDSCPNLLRDCSVSRSSELSRPALQRLSLVSHQYEFSSFKVSFCIHHCRLAPRRNRSVHNFLATRTSSRRPVLLDFSSANVHSPRSLSRLCIPPPVFRMSVNCANTYCSFWRQDELAPACFCDGYLWASSTRPPLSLRTASFCYWSSCC